MTLMVGCSQSCTPGAAIGKYSMRAGEHVYELCLATGGVGTLSRDEKAENIKWEWENEQVFLDLSGNLATELEALSAPLLRQLSRRPAPCVPRLLTFRDSGGGIDAPFLY
jgi:hypothetical protein